MENVLAIRIVLVALAVLVFFLILKVARAIDREKRIARYSLDIRENSELSLFDLLINQYHNIILKYQGNKFLNKQSIKYKKYLRDEVSPVVFVMNKLVMGIVLVVLVIISSAIQGRGINFIWFLISFVFGYYLYDIYLVFEKKVRFKKIKNDMLRAVIIMNNAFKAGKSTLQAVDIASRELPDPIRLEFLKIYQDMSYGLSVDVAFQRFASRVKLEEATYIASSLTILNKTGGNIVHVFNSIEKTLFDKKKLEEDLKNSTAATNLVVKVLMVIPVLFILIIYVISPSYFVPLYTKPLGMFVIGIIIFMFSIYIYLLNKIMKVKV